MPEVTPPSERTATTGKATINSWTVIVNILIIVAEAVNALLTGGALGSIIPVEWHAIIIAVVNLILRFKTSAPITGLITAKPTS